MSVLLVFGARNLGGALVDRFGSHGWDLATVSLGDETANAVRGRHPQALALTGDASRREDMERILAAVLERFGALDLAVNAISPPRRVETDGELSLASPEALKPYVETLIPSVFHFFSVCGKQMTEQGRGTLVQVTGGSARRATPGRGAWSAAAHATKAFSHAAAQELRRKGVHAALLVVDALIESEKTRSQLEGKSGDHAASHDDVADAVEFLERQSPRGWTHELTITPRGDRWLP